MFLARLGLRRTPPAGPQSGVSHSGERDRWDELDGFRGLLAVAIVVFHCNQESRDGLGRYVYEGSWVNEILWNLEASVAAFLALSGFLLFLPFARAAIAGAESPSIRSFLSRRLLRVAPPYWIAILLVWAARFGGGWDQVLSLIEHLSFTQVFDARHIFWDIGPAWFLADNMLFYLVAAAAGLACCRLCGRFSRRATRIGVLVLGLAGLAAVSVAYKWWAADLAHIPSTNYPVYFGPLAKFDLFALGMLLAVVSAALAGRRPVGPVLRLGLLGTGVAILAYAFHERFLIESVGLYFHTISGIAFSLILAALVLSPSTGVVKRALSLRPMRQLGLVSYSLFLWHEPVLLLMTTSFGLLAFSDPASFGGDTVILVAVALVVAGVAHRYIEIPSGHLRQLFAATPVVLPDVPANVEELRALTWQGFELLLRRACENLGWKVVGGGITKGQRLMLEKGSERRTLCCELWWRRLVDRGDMDALIRRLVSDGAQEMGILTGGELNASAERMAEAAGFQVIAGTELVTLLGQAGQQHPWLDINLLPSDVEHVLRRLDLVQAGDGEKGRKRRGPLTVLPR